MINLKKVDHCIEMAKKCKNQAISMHFAIMLAPTKADYDLCTRKFERAVRHAAKYISLMEYYGGVR